MMHDLIFGSHALLACMHAGLPISKVWVQANKKTPLYKEIVSLAHQHAIPLCRVPLAKLHRLTKKQHQGVVGWRAPIAYVPLDHLVQGSFEKGKMPLLLLLDGVTDGGNVGAMVRTALAADVTGLVVGPRTAPLTGQTMKASAGALAHLPIARVSCLAKAITFLQESGVQVVACTEKGQESMYKSSLAAPTSLLLGDEGRGIDPSLLKAADKRVAIPMHGCIGSLNVSVAAAVMLYEAVRQRLS